MHVVNTTRPSIAAIWGTTLWLGDGAIVVCVTCYGEGAEVAVRERDKGAPHMAPNWPNVAAV